MTILLTFNKLSQVNRYYNVEKLSQSKPPGKSQPASQSNACLNNTANAAD